MATFENNSRIFKKTATFWRYRAAFGKNGRIWWKTAEFWRYRAAFWKKTAAFCKIQGRILLIEQIGVACIFRNPNPGTKSQKPGKYLENGQEHSPVHYKSKIFQFLNFYNFHCNFLTTVVATLRLKTLALADISSDMTLEIEVIIILELTRNRYLDNLCEKHGITKKISVKNLEKTRKIH